MPVKGALVAADRSGAHELAPFAVAMNLAGAPWLTIIYPTPGMKSVRAVDKGLTGETYGKARNKGLMSNDGYAEPSGLILIRRNHTPPATQMVVKRRGLWPRSLEVWQGKELRADDFGQKPAKRGIASDVWQAKDLA